MKFKKFKTQYTWYTIEQQGDDGKWKESGVDDENKKEVLKELVKVNFLGCKARVVEHRSISRPIGKVRDYRLK